MGGPGRKGQTVFVLRVELDKPLGVGGGHGFQCYGAILSPLRRELA